MLDFNFNIQFEKLDAKSLLVKIIAVLVTLVVSGLIIYYSFIKDDSSTVIINFPDPDVTTTSRSTGTPSIPDPSGYVEDHYSNYTWVQLNQVSATEMQSSGNQYGMDLYVARAWFNDRWIPGTAGGRECWIANSGFEYVFSESECQILIWTSETLNWVPTRNIPRHALVLDKNDLNEPYYICRGWFESMPIYPATLIIGKVLRTQGICYVPFHGEQKITNYEVLVNNACERQFVTPSYPIQNITEWVSHKSVDESSLMSVGNELNYPVFIARVFHYGHWVPGKAHTNSENGNLEAHITYNGIEHYTYDFQVLIWPSQKVVWISTNIYRPHIPERAIKGGTDPSTGETTYICRGFYDTSLIVGKTSWSTSGFCILPYYGEIRVNKYEVLAENACDPPELGAAPLLNNINFFTQMSALLFIASFYILM